MGKAINEIDSYTGSVSDTTLIPVSDSDTLQASAALKLWTYIKSKADAVYSTFSGAYADLTGKPTLGTAAALDHGTAAGNLVRLDATTAKLPAVDGSLLTGLPTPDLASPGPIGGTTPDTVTATGVTVSGGTRTTSGTSVAITETWNNAAVTFPGALKVDVTDTASNAASLMMDLQVGGASKFRVNKSGGILSASGGSFGGDVNINGASLYAGTGFQVGNGASIRFSNGSIYSANIQIDAANTLAQRNGTAAQTQRIYNTYTSLSNRENFKVEWAANICTIGTEAVGATQRPLVIAGSTVSIDAPLYVKQYTTATRPAWVNGAQIFDTDLDKLLIGGLSAWEVVTSS